MGMSTRRLPKKKPVSRLDTVSSDNVRTPKTVSVLAEKLLAKLKDGLSIREACRDLNLDPKRFYDYKQRYPAFEAAVRDGLWLGQGWWEAQGRQNLENKGFHATLWHINMRNRFGWKDGVTGDDEFEEIPGPRFINLPGVDPDTV